MIIIIISDNKIIHSIIIQAIFTIHPSICRPALTCIPGVTTAVGTSAKRSEWSLIRQHTPLSMHNFADQPESVSDRPLDSEKVELIIISTSPSIIICIFAWKCLTAPPGGADYTEIAPPLPRPCCRAIFLASTLEDGKGELLQKKQRRAQAIWHHRGPPPPPWQQPACCNQCEHRLFQKKRKTRKAGNFEERGCWTHFLSRCVFFKRYSWHCNGSAHVLKSSSCLLVLQTAA